MSFPVKPHLPLITQRIKFHPSPLPSLPSITLRQKFDRQARRLIRRSRTPYARPQTRFDHADSDHEHKSREPADDDSENDSSESDLSSLDDSEDGEDGEDGEDDEDTAKAATPKKKIPKPPGEAGRKNCGGYNLETELNWTHIKYENFVSWLNEQVGKKLDPSKSFTYQEPKALRDLIQKASEKFKIGDVYENDWPIREALKLRLKYTSEQARKQVQKKKEKSLRKAIIGSGE